MPAFVRHPWDRVIVIALVIGAVVTLAATDPAGNPTPGQVPIGTILAYGGRWESLSATQGWLPCDGRELTASAYPELFAVLGGAWGQSPEEGTFRLPDLRGRFLRGVNHAAPGGWRDPDAEQRLASAPGGSTGDHVGSLQEDATGPHTHTLLGVANAAGPGTDDGWVRFFFSKIPDVDAPVLRNQVAVAPGAGTETRPPNAAVNWIIRVR